LDWHGPVGLQLDRNSGRVFAASLDGITVFDAKNLSNWQILVPASVFQNQTIDWMSGSMAVDSTGQTVFVQLFYGLIGAVRLSDNVREGILMLPFPHYVANFALCDSQSVTYYPGPSSKGVRATTSAWFQYSAKENAFYGLASSPSPFFSHTRTLNH
jgi:hypothetical protein